MAGKSLKVEDLLLDLDNPRISKSLSQREALQKVIEDQDVKLAALAQSIIQDGLNPMDRLLVIKSGDEAGKFVVLEGNRRLATLKILTNPAVLSSIEIRPALQKRLEALASEFDPASIGSLDCFVLGNRNDGAMWIKQRHTGENEGRGIVNWGGVARARFRGTDPALQALDLVLQFGDLTDEEKDGIEERFPITTLDRLLSTPAVRAAIGVDILQSKLISDLPPSELIKPLRRMVRDLANGTVNVTALKKKEQQLTYIGKLGTDLPDLAKASGSPKPVDSLEADDFNPNPKPKPQPKQQPQPQASPKPRTPPRKTLIPRDCGLSVTNAKIAEIVKELRGLTLTDYPHAISVLFRVFLEQSTDHYLTSVGIPLQVPTGGGNKDKKLKAKVQDAVDHMIANGIPKKDLDGISKGVVDTNNPLCVETLNNYVHNRFYSPRERDLKVAWDNAQLYFERIWK